jgi:hypothetical protein
VAKLGCGKRPGTYDSGALRLQAEHILKLKEIITLLKRITNCGISEMAYTLFL